MAAETDRQRLARELLFASFIRASTPMDDPRVIERLAHAVQAQIVRAGEVLFREGDDAECVYFMSEGRLRLSRPNHPDWVYEGWWVVGSVDVLARRPRLRTAVAETDLRLTWLPAERWFEVMRERPEGLLRALVDFARGAVAIHAQLAPDGGFLATVPPSRRHDVLTLAGRTRLLASLPLFRDMAVQVLVELAQLARLHDLAPAEPLFEAGSPAGRAFVVAEGAVEVYRPDPPLSATFAAGSLVGGPLMLGHTDAPWSARAVGPARVISFVVEDLFDHLEWHPDFVRTMMATLALEQERLREELAARTGELFLR